MFDNITMATPKIADNETSLRPDNYCQSPIEHDESTFISSSHPQSITSIDIDINENMEALLRPYDILCGRGRDSYNNVGNRRFRIFIGLHLNKYIEAEGRRRKGRVIDVLVRTLVDEMGARFFRENNGKLVDDLSVKQIRQKVGHALRDLAAFNASTTGRKKAAISVEDGAQPVAEEVRSSISGNQEYHETAESAYGTKRRSIRSSRNSLLLAVPRGFDAIRSANDIASFSEPQRSRIKKKAELKSESSPESISLSRKLAVASPHDLIESMYESLSSFDNVDDENQPKGRACL